MKRISDERWKEPELSAIGKRLWNPDDEDDFLEALHSTLDAQLAADTKRIRELVEKASQDNPYMNERGVRSGKAKAYSLGLRAILSQLPPEELQK